ncbi:hypothetical protein AAHE18_15G245400 [Arachis hypogaea]
MPFGLQFYSKIASLPHLDGVISIVTINGTRYHEYWEAPYFERGWNHAKLSYEASDGYKGMVPGESIAKEIGIHVLKQESSSIEDIRFTDPYKMTQVIIMMIMLSIALPNHKKQPLLLQTCIGLWTLLFLTMHDLDKDSELGSEGLGM